MGKQKYFGTDGIRGCVGESIITAEFVLKLGWAVGKVLSQNLGGRILIGKDTRVSGYMFESALEAGLASAGVDIHLLGPMPTPAVAYLTRTQRARAGIVISASHNLYQDNGIKFFSADGYKLDDTVEMAIERLIDQPMTTVCSDKLGKAVRIDDAPGRYIEFCKSTVSNDVSFDGLKIVVDCANGATYHIAPSVFRELGAEVIEVGVDPNGYNINLKCGSTHPENLQQQVLAHHADLGIALDGDGDRVLMVDHRGEVIDGDQLLYIMTKYRLDTNTMNGGVVGTVMTNMGFEKALEKEKVPFIRANVGDRYVIEKMLSNKWVIGGEQSGHIISLDHTTSGDGIVTALQVMSALSHFKRSLADIKRGMEKFPQTLVNIKVTPGVNIMENPALQKAIKQAETALGDNGRVLIRMSGTEPLVRVMVEANDEELLTKYVDMLTNVVTECCHST